MCAGSFKSSCPAIFITGLCPAARSSFILLLSEIIIKYNGRRLLRIALDAFMMGGLLRVFDHNYGLFTLLRGIILLFSVLFFLLSWLTLDGVFAVHTRVVSNKLILRLSLFKGDRDRL